MSDVTTLQELLEKRLHEMGGPREPKTLLAAYNDLPEGGDWVSYEVVRRVSRGHTRITDRAARTLATMLGVHEDAVREAAGQRPRLEPFELPPRASRLDENERGVVLAVVDAILAAAEGNSRPAAQADQRWATGPATGSKQDHGLAARRARRQPTDDVGDGA